MRGWIALVTLLGCVPTVDSGRIVANRPDSGGIDGSSSDSSGIDANPLDSGGIDAGQHDGSLPATVCDPWSPHPPPAALNTIWNEAVLSATGPQTLGGHGHDDGRPPLGFCPAPPGDAWRLIAARMETDQDLNNNGRHDVTPVDTGAADPVYSAYGMGESGGRHHVYVELLDGNGARVHGEIEIRFQGGSSMVVATDPGKPANEFPFNFAIWGGNVLTIRVSGPTPSDAVTNLRIPNNHHVSYLLTFARR